MCPAGSPAEESGVAVGDQIVSVNKQDISGLTHLQLVGIIKKVQPPRSCTVLVSLSSASWMHAAE